MLLTIGFSRQIRFAPTLACVLLAHSVTLLVLASSCGGGGGGNTDRSVTVIAYNDLGMHCLNQDFSELMVLPPFNTLRAVVVDRTGEDPRYITSGVTLEYALIGNTHSSDKVNFWTYANALLGMPLAPDVGVTGHSLAGAMTAAVNDWEVTGIPATPIDDMGNESAYQRASVKVYRSGTLVGQTETVVPVSWEMACNACHNTPGISTATDILRKHDQLHGTTLESHKPVLCAGCHADPALGAAGQPGVSTLSAAMHTAHATRMAGSPFTNPCYACHPGVKTQCLRDVHASKGMTCTNCHGSMSAVGNAARKPWQDEPKCGSAGCHQVAGHQYEQLNTLYRNSAGHHGIRCYACHGSPHAITPTVTALDNAQTIALQGHSGPINTCNVCHRSTPGEGFNHSLSDND